MTVYLSIILFLPTIFGALALFAPRRLALWTLVAGTVLTLAYSIVMLARFKTGVGMQFITDDNWISELGIRYSLGVDGLNLFLIVLTSLLWVPATVAAALRDWDRPRLFAFFMGIAQTAVLGAFMSQDLALFVVFFDLMLVPFYFLVGMWGGEDRVYATTKLVIYTLVGSLLMLAAAVALGVMSTPAGGHISFSFATLAQHPLSGGSQYWLFILFAFAFLVKAPAFPLHGWMPDAYRQAPLPVILVFSAVVSKVGVYGFLRIVLPLLPQASVHFQELMLAIAVVSILYGSVLAFSQDEARLVLGYSSIAQLGFILLGIFSLDPKGGQGAVLQMVNHGLVVAPLFLIIGYLAIRAQGRESLDWMGGMAFRAPVLATVFLIVALATLAMPGSANFVGELYILFGTFQSKIVYGLVASVGVVLAAVYMIRFYQRAMHNPVGAHVESRDLALGPELGVIAPLVLVILALGVYPNFLLHRINAFAPTTKNIPQVALKR
ncbi:MAG TPA: NADH-quinone oxidoreductase subunit M [Thermoleophilaceae bacterium]|jgi:NADH-quinone oxidoreductase subunit M